SWTSTTRAPSLRESSARFRGGSPNAAPRRNCCVRSSGNSKNRGSINRLLAAELHGLTAAMRECNEELRRTHPETGVAGRGLRELSAGTPLAATTIKTVLGQPRSLTSLGGWGCSGDSAGGSCATAVAPKFCNIFAAQRFLNLLNGLAGTLSAGHRTNAAPRMFPPTP